ncbi:MAG TPA: alpha/beta hydrolase [Burkholderiaceae bacterium]
MLDRFKQAKIPANGVTINLRHGGSGPPLLLLHGFPQTHVIWHAVADRLAETYTLVMPDLRGYGDSSKPAGLPDHANYSKRTMAQDMVEVMRLLGHESFFVCGHDRGGRVAHRLALDHAERVRKLMMIDISPTRTMYEKTNEAFARYYYHWFFLIQPYPLPETLIGADPRFYLRFSLGGWGSEGKSFLAPEAMTEYERCFCTPEAVHAACEDYRAAATIDLEHDRAEQKIACPVHVVWGEHGVVGRLFHPIADWQEKAQLPVTGVPVAAGHFIPEEKPDWLLEQMLAFFM